MNKQLYLNNLDPVALTFIIIIAGVVLGLLYIAFDYKKQNI